jgi:5-methyltetrahydrofolate--homocysteine methyltransferase
MIGIEAYKCFHEEHDDYNKIILQALADRLAEAFAELLLKRCVRNYGVMHPPKRLAMKT